MSSKGCHGLAHFAWFAHVVVWAALVFHCRALEPLLSHVAAQAYNLICSCQVILYSLQRAQHAQHAYCQMAANLRKPVRLVILQADTWMDVWMDVWMHLDDLLTEC